MPKRCSIFSKNVINKIHFDNAFLTKQINLIPTEINKWPNRYEKYIIQKNEKRKSYDQASEKSKSVS